jgi:hypothetical protein
LETTQTKNTNIKKRRLIPTGSRIFAVKGHVPLGFGGAYLNTKSAKVGRIKQIKHLDLQKAVVENKSSYSISFCLIL